MANTIRLLSTLALMGAVRNVAEKYEAVTGARIEADFAPTLALLDRLRRGEAGDVLILTQEGLAGLVAKGEVVAESRVDLARSFVGFAVKAGAVRPDIATKEALRSALLGARSVAYSRLGASGIFFAQLIQTWESPRKSTPAPPSFPRVLPPNGSSRARPIWRFSRSAS